MGYFDFEIGLYLRILFGLQLIDYLLFALLVFVVHAVVNQKHLGYLVALIAYGVIVFAPRLGIEHNLLIYGSGSRVDLLGHARLRPVPRAVAVVQALLGGVGSAAGRCGKAAVGARHGAQSAVAASRRPSSHSSADRRCGRDGGGAHRRAGRFHLLQHERAERVRHGRRTDGAARRVRAALRTVRGHRRSHGSPATTLRVEIYPERREAEIRGTYRLVNDSAVAIDSIHLATSAQVETGAVSFDRPRGSCARGRRTRLPDLCPGDSRSNPASRCSSSFEVHFAPHGFRNDGVDAFGRRERQLLHESGLVACHRLSAESRAR